MSFVLGAFLLACVTALACALPGVFIVLRHNAMLVDAISHAVLPGIVVGYLFTGDLRSPLLVVGAAVAGFLVVLGSEWLRRTRLITGDAPQGLIFPALFSIGIILISQNFGDVHLDTHAVLVGDLNLASIAQLTIAGTAIGPSYLYLMLIVLLVNVAYLALFTPRLKIVTFDQPYAHSLGLRVGLLNISLMLLVAITVTAAFHAVGAILVVALIVVPAATAFLLSTRLGTMFVLTAVFALAGATGGFWIAYWLNAPTSAAMATLYGVMFTAVLIATRVSRRAGHRRVGQRLRGGSALQPTP